MSFRGYSLLVAGVVFGAILLGKAISQQQAVVQPGQTPTQTPSAPAEPQKPRQMVDVRADKVYSDQAMNERLGIDSKAMILVGQVAFHHNGAVIACDSAVRYSDRRIDCFSASGSNDVIISKDSTFIYCDRAEYNGEQNTARVYSPIIKVTDGDAMLYAYNFSFNTQSNVGRWWGGGVVYQKDNVMESESGFYYSDLHELVATRNAQMKNDSHELTSDSVRYNTETKVASFYTRTVIWTEKGEMITAWQGRYNTADSTYLFHDRAYVLDEFRESWADTIDYNGRSRDGIFYGNIQIDDREHHSSAFGDLAQYWGARGETMLTRRPSMLNHDEEQGSRDTMYMRADTLFMQVRYPSDNSSKAPLSDNQGAMPPVPPSDSLGGRGDSLVIPSVDSIAMQLRADSILHAARVDSLARIDSIRTVDPKAYQAIVKAEKQRAKAEQKRIKAEAKRLKAEKRNARMLAKVAARAAKMAERQAIRNAKREARIAARRRAAGAALDSLRADSMRRDSLSLDSLHLDSIRAGALSLDSLTLDSLSAEPDSDTTFRIFRGWRNVRIWRRDTQALCDSMVGYSADSTIHLYVDPIMWHGVSQVTADSIVVHTASQKIERAEFFGDPIIGSQIGGERSRQFNQVKGRHMTSRFRNGELYRHDTDGNALAIYYMQEEEPDPLDTTRTVMSAPMAFISSNAETISFIFRSDSLDYIVQRQTVKYTVYPMDKIPSTQPTQMQGFRWQIERKPVLADVFDRQMRASQRELYEAMPRPGFPIVDRIDKRRQYLIQNRMWADRNDPLPAYAIAFLREKYRP